MGTRRKIKAYRHDLDQVLLSGSIEALKAFMAEHGVPKASSDAVLEITRHKAITASTTLPRHYRRQSKAWLIARGLRSWDDGDLLT